MGKVKDLDTECDKLLDIYITMRCMSPDDFEEPEEWEGYKLHLKNLIYNLLTMPVREAFWWAEQDGWLWKRYRELVFVVADTS